MEIVLIISEMETRKQTTQSRLAWSLDCLTKKYAFLASIYMIACKVNAKVRERIEIDF